MKITKLFKTFFFASLVVFFTGCSSSSIPIPLSLDAGATNYDELVGEALIKMQSKLATLKKNKEIVLVTDFVNVDKLQNKSKLGFLLSSTLKDNLSANYDLTIREAKLGKHFSMGEEGLKILSNKHANVDPNLYYENYAIVGTYTLTSKQLIIFIKVIDIYNGHVLASTSTRTRLTEELKELDKTKSKRVIYSPMVL